jgi:hypothetical protein
MTMLSPGCISGSGVLPAASRSNMLSAASSAGDLFGARGRGLSTPDGVTGRALDGDAGGKVAVLWLGLDDRGCTPPGVPFASPADLALINFPCRELGGGGGFFTMAGAGCKAAGALLAELPRSSSPCSDVSRDVCGVSWIACSVSDIDWCDAEDVSAVLVLSPPGIGGCLACWAYCAVACDESVLPAA